MVSAVATASPPPAISPNVAATLPADGFALALGAALREPPVGSIASGLAGSAPQAGAPLLSPAIKRAEGDEPVLALPEGTSSQAEPVPGTTPASNTPEPVVLDGVPTVLMPQAYPVPVAIVAAAMPDARPAAYATPTSGSIPAAASAAARSNAVPKLKASSQLPLGADPASAEGEPAFDSADPQAIAVGRGERMGGAGRRPQLSGADPAAVELSAGYDVPLPPGGGSVAAGTTLLSTTSATAVAVGTVASQADQPATPLNARAQASVLLIARQDLKGLRGAVSAVAEGSVTSSGKVIEEIGSDGPDRQAAVPAPDLSTGAVARPTPAQAGDVAGLATLAAPSLAPTPVASPNLPLNTVQGGDPPAPHMPANPVANDPVVAAQPGRIGHETGIEIARRLSNGGDELIVRLVPGDLGRIEVRMAFDEHGALRASIAADSPIALEMLRRDSADLSRALGDAGVRSDANSLRFQADGGGGSASGGHPRSPWLGADAKTAAYHADSGTTEDAQPVAYRSVRTSGNYNLIA